MVHKYYGEKVRDSNKPKLQLIEGNLEEVDSVDFDYEITDEIRAESDNFLVQQVMAKYLRVPRLLLKPSAVEFRDKMEQLPKETRVKLARANPVIFAEYYLRPYNKQWNTDAEDYQYLLMQAVMESAQTIVHIPIEHGKSTWISEVFPLWNLINDRNIRMGIFSRTARQAERFGRRLMWHIEHNDRLHEDFGEYLMPDFNEKWTQAEGYVVRDKDRQTKDPTFQFLGAGGAINGARLDIIICDDILDLTNSQTVNTRESIYNWFTEMVISRLVEGGKCAMVGTLQSRLDLYCVLSESEEFTYVHIKALDESTHTTLSQRWPYERLMAKKRTVGAVKFEKLFQNNRNAQTGRLLNPAWLNYYGRTAQSGYEVTLPPFEQLSFYIGIDPAIADKDYIGRLESGDSDFFCIQVGGWHHKSQRLFIIETFKARVTLTEQLRLIQEYNERYKPILIGIEAVQYQKALAQAATAISAQLPIKQIPTTMGDGAKIARIEALGVHFETRRIWVHPDNQDFISEFISYPDVDHDDVLDACEILLRTIGNRPARRMTAKEGAALRSIRLH